MIRQRNPNSPRISAVRPMVRSDLAALQAKSTGAQIKRLRDSHHVMARLLASGMSKVEVAHRCGFSQTRVSILSNSPAMKELIEKYRSIATAEWAKSQDEYYSYIYSNSIKAHRMIADQLDKADEENEDIPLRQLLAIADSGADRIGYTKKSTTINVNVDFAAKLEAARRRSLTITANPGASTDAA